ncbi:uncharacterized protein [Watersipora subatra]|uniref:uncharacterized protein n=1 Tax=Watersipora subatra TaxID=2589382 RepID=UPI00355C1394
MSDVLYNRAGGPRATLMPEVMVVTGSYEVTGSTRGYRKYERLQEYKGVGRLGEASFFTSTAYDVELQNLTKKSDRESEVKRGHTGQDWWTCKTKGVKSSEYVEIGSQQGTAQGTKDVQGSMGCDGEQSHDEVREGAEKVAEPVSVMEKVCSFLAEVSSNGMLDREGHEKKVAEIEREEREVRRKSKEKLAKLKAKREAAVMELENVKAFRVVVQELAEVQRRIAGSRPALVAGEVELDRSGPMPTPSSVVPSPVQPVTAQVETSHRKPVEPASYWGERGKDGRDGDEVEESLLTQPKDSGLVRVGGSSVGDVGGRSVGSDSGHGKSIGSGGGQSDGKASADWQWSWQ